MGFRRIWPAAALLLACLGHAAVTGASPAPLRTHGGVVAADNPLASQAGAAVLAAGGNAADAAAATALALGVVNPQSSGLGGGGFALVYVAAENKVYALDFREVAPAALTADRFLRDGKVDTRLSRSGGLAVAVPGEVAGLTELVRRFGRRRWRDAVDPARRLAVRGFPVGTALARAAREVAPGTKQGGPLGSLVAPGGRPLAEGARLRRPKLGAALATLAARGAAGFYEGATARDLVAAVRAAGGVLTADDLTGYRAVERTPMTSTWRGNTIVLMPLPSSSGIVILEVLGILDANGSDLAAMGANSAAALHVIVEALKHAFADRAHFLGDPAFAEDPTQRLLAPARLARIGRRIAADRVLPNDQYGEPPPPDAPPAKGGGTSHLCVVDRDGNAVALTTTVNGLFGSAVVGRVTGIVLNNQVDDFALALDTPNMFGLVQGAANLVGPGKRPLSSMAPMLVLRDGHVVGCLGGSGGPKIISDVVQVFLDAFVFGMDAASAVSAPRVHHQWRPDKLQYERELPAEVVDGLSKRGHTVEPLAVTVPPTVQLVLVRDDGTREAASDPRKGGAPAAEPEK